MITTMAKTAGSKVQVHPISSPCKEKACNDHIIPESDNLDPAQNGAVTMYPPAMKHDNEVDISYSPPQVYTVLSTRATSLLKHEEQNSIRKGENKSLVWSHILFPSFILPSFVAIAREATGQSALCRPLIAHYATTALVYSLDRWSDNIISKTTIGYLILGSTTAFLLNCDKAASHSLFFMLTCLAVYPAAKKHVPYGKYPCNIIAFVVAGAIGAVGEDGEVSYSLFRQLIPFIVWSSCCILSSASTCDIKDVDDDTFRGVVTLPTTIGPGHTKRLAVLLSTVAAFTLQTRSTEGGGNWLSSEDFFKNPATFGGILVSLAFFIGYSLEWVSPNDLDALFGLPLIISALQMCTNKA